MTVSMAQPKPQIIKALDAPSALYIITYWMGLIDTSVEREQICTKPDQWDLFNGFWLGILIHNGTW